MVLRPPLPSTPIHTHRGPVFGIDQLGQSVLLSGFLLSSTFRGPVCDPVCSIPPVPCSESIRGVVPPPLLFNIKLICEFVFLPPPGPQYICPMALSHTCAHTIFQSKCLYSQLPTYQPIPLSSLFCRLTLLGSLGFSLSVNNGSVECFISPRNQQPSPWPCPSPFNQSL